MARAATSTGAESIRCDLSDLFASPTDPALEATLAKALDFARSFETRFRGKLGSLEPLDFAGMMAELEVAEETAISPRSTPTCCTARTRRTQGRVACWPGFGRRRPSGACMGSSSR